MKKTENRLEQVINKKDLLEKVQSAGITTLEELCNCSPRELTEKGIESLYVKDIAIILQCNGMDLRKNSSKKR